jgi:hypothetical protein
MNLGSTRIENKVLNQPINRQMIRLAMKPQRRVQHQKITTNQKLNEKPKSYSLH